MPNLTAAYVLLSMSYVCTGVTAADEPSFRVVTKHAEDRVHIESIGDSYVFSVESPRGIGNAIVRRPKHGWPERAMMVRLHLKGLEELRLSANDLTWTASISTISPKARVSIRKANIETEIYDPQSRYWAEVKNEQPFTVKMPKALFENDPESITINWIDFYR